MGDKLKPGQGSQLAARWTEGSPSSSLYPLSLSLHMKFSLSLNTFVCDRKVDVRLPGKGNLKLPWRKAGHPSHPVDVVDSDQ